MRGAPKRVDFGEAFSVSESCPDCARGGDPRDLIEKPLQRGENGGRPLIADTADDVVRSEALRRAEGRIDDSLRSGANLVQIRQHGTH